MELIDKQKAIEAIEGMIIPDPYHECNKNHGHDEHNMAIADCVATIEALPSAVNVPETNVGKMVDTISRNQAIDAIRAMQTYKLFAGDDTLLIDQAGAQTELMLLPPAQPEIIRCKDCKYNATSKKCLNPNSFFLVPADDDFCSYAERREVAE